MNKCAPELCVLPVLKIGSSEVNLFCNIESDLKDVIAASASWHFLAVNESGLTETSEGDLYRLAQEKMNGFKGNLFTPAYTAEQIQAMINQVPLSKELKVRVAHLAKAQKT